MIHFCVDTIPQFVTDSIQKLASAMLANFEQVWKDAGYVRTHPRVERQVDPEISFELMRGRSRFFGGVQAEVYCIFKSAS